MDEINHILLHTIVQRLVFRPSTKRVIVPIIFSSIQTSRYRFFQVSVPVDINLFQDCIEHALDISLRQHITLHVTEGGEVCLPLLLD